jgi:HD-GYP domain-containing protein (c-di-GMP phosphodiesterase class II)
MPLPAKLKSTLISFEPSKVPLCDKGRVLTDLYVELPRNDRFIRYVCSGDDLTAKHVATLSRHTVKHFYVVLGDLETQDKTITQPNNETSFIQRFSGDNERYESARRSVAPRKEVEFEASRVLASAPDTTSSRQSHGVPAEDRTAVVQFGKESAEFYKKPIAQELSRIYQDLITPSPAKLNLEDSPISQLADRLVDTIAPEVANLRAYLKSIPQYVGMVNDSAAITAIATLFAIARGQSSRSVFKDLSYACLFMDISLADFPQDSWRTYYLNPSKLGDEDMKRMQQHPRRSAELVQKRFRNLPDIVSQLIVGHHELYNGKGFPRELRSELLAPLVRILALAVDVFEYMKREQLRGEVCSLEEALEYFLFESVEPHLRRHSTVLCREVADYFKHPENTKLS